MTKQTKTLDATGWYSTVFSGWQSNLLGRKPTAGELATIHALGARPGKQALANAMALRDGGVTGAQIVMATGAPQLNKMRGFIADGVVKRVPTPPASNGHQVYRIALTPKGEVRVKRANAAGEAAPTAPAKPAKARTARKPRKPATPAPAQVNATPATGDAPVTGDNAQPNG